MTKSPFKFEYAAIADTRSDPAHHRRARLVERLQEQAKLAVDPTATTRTITRNKGKGENKKVVEIKQIIRPTWRVGPNGKLLFWVKTGAGKIEFAPGQFAIVVDLAASIPAMIEALVERVATGEFDKHLVKPKTEKHPSAAGKNAKPAGTPVKPPARVAAGKRRAA